MVFNPSIKLKSNDFSLWIKWWDDFLNEKYNTYLVVRSCNIKYKKSGFFEDELTIFTKLIGYSSSRLTLEQTIKREKELIVFSEIQLVTVNKKGKLVKIPDILIKKLESII